VFSIGIMIDKNRPTLQGARKTRTTAFSEPARKGCEFATAETLRLFEKLRRPSTVLIRKVSGPRY
jgi:hypothetical protein